MVATGLFALLAFAGGEAGASCVGWLGWWRSRGYDPAATSALAKAGVGVDPAWWTAQVAAGTAGRTRHLRLTDGREVRIGRLIGQGHEGFVFCLDPGCANVIKLARTPSTPSQVTGEATRARELSEAGFYVAPVLATQIHDVPYLIKAFEPGPSFAKALRKGLSAAQIDALAEIYLMGLRTGVHPDLMGTGRENLVWNAGRRRWMFVDAGPESAPAFYQPLGVLFKAGGRVTTTLMTYLGDVFEGRRREADHFHAAVQQRLAPPR